MATVNVWVEFVDYSTAVGDNDPVCRDIETLSFTRDYWGDALEDAYEWIKKYRNPKYTYHLNM